MYLNFSISLLYLLVKMIVLITAELKLQILVKLIMSNVREHDSDVSGRELAFSCIAKDQNNSKCESYFFSLKLRAGITVHFFNFSDLYFLKAAITHVGTCEILFSVLVIWSIAISETLGEIIISGST